MPVRIVWQKRSRRHEIELSPRAANFPDSVAHPHLETIFRQEP